MEKHIILGVVLTAVLCGCVQEPAETTTTTAVKIPGLNQSAAYTEVNAEEANQIIQAIPDLVILDVRGPAYYPEGHIPGAINIPEDRIPENLQNLDPEKTYLLYCGGNKQSVAVGNILSENGYNRIYRLVDGYKAWREKGYPREK